METPWCMYAYSFIFYRLFCSVECVQSEKTSANVVAVGDVVRLSSSTVIS